ncbi:50S ribosomal protein L11 [Candidatus Micrarchaeota archaeon]|nr:50S ribosomal protein L11 [Candidatus Micrarchaeota archaeon]
MDKTIDAIVEGGKATPGPPLAPALAPLGVNIGQVVAKINESTKDFSGMKVPVKITVNTKTKTFEVEVGSPPTAELIKKEAKVEKGSGTKDRVGNLSIQSVVKIAKQKKTTSLGKTIKDIAKEVVGSCVSMGIAVEGKDPREVEKDIGAKKYDSVLTE